MANEEPKNRSDKNPYVIKLALLALAVVVGILLLWQMTGEDEVPEEPPLVLDQPAPEPEPVPPVSVEPEPGPVVKPPVEERPEPPLPDLADSDAVALAVAEELSPTEDLRGMLVEDSVIMKSVRAVIGLADGNVVHEYRPVKSPDTPFIADKLDEPPDEIVGQRYRLSPRNYQRYDKYVAIVSALDPENVARLYQRFYPLLSEAYVQHGVDRGSFKAVTLEAIDSLLAAPVLEEEPVLIQPRVHFQFQDRRLESLPGPQKLLIRMGPENTRKVQAVLRQIRREIAALEVQQAQ